LEEVFLMKKILPILLALALLSANCGLASAAAILKEDEEDSFSVLIDGIEHKYAQLFAGVHMDNGKYHIMATDIAALRKALDADSGLAEAYAENKPYIVFEQADFTRKQIDSVMDKIGDEFSKSKSIASWWSDEKNIMIQASANVLKSHRASILAIAESVKSKTSGTSLAGRIVFIPGEPEILETMETSPSEIAELYVLDAKNQAYIKADSKARDMISNVMEKAVLLKKTLPMREGAALVFLKDGTRLSYFFEANGDLNVNGACYRVQPAAREAFEKRLAESKANASLAKRPKWLAWMQLESVTAVSSGKAQDYRDIQIESGKRLALAELNTPENARKAEISFISGVKYTLAFAGDSLYITSSDMSYACAYTLRP
jgi:hypothetical protein